MPARQFAIILLAVMTLGLSSLALTAAEQSAGPSKEVAIELLALRDERFKKDYTVAIVIPGETKFGQVRTSQAAEVIYFGPVIVEGKKIRQRQSETFLWNEDYGWFLFDAEGERLGRAIIFVWSELKGEVEVD